MKPLMLTLGALCAITVLSTGWLVISHYSFNQFSPSAFELLMLSTGISTVIIAIAGGIAVYQDIKGDSHE